MQNNIDTSNNNINTSNDNVYSSNNLYDIEMQDLINNKIYNTAKYYINKLNSQISLNETFYIFEIFTSIEYYNLFQQNDAEDIYHIISNFMIHKMRSNMLERDITYIYFHIKNEFNKKACLNIYEIRLLNLIELSKNVFHAKTLQDFSELFYYLNQFFFNYQACYFIIDDKFFLSNILFNKFINIISQSTYFDLLAYFLQQETVYYTDYYLFLYVYYEIVNKTFYLPDAEFIIVYEYIFNKQKINKENIFYNLYFIYEIRKKIINLNLYELIFLYNEMVCNYNNKIKKISDFDYINILNILLSKIYLLTNSDQLIISIK